MPELTRKEKRTKLIVILIALMFIGMSMTFLFMSAVA